MKKILSLPKSSVDFISNILKELKLVEFPSRKETFKMTYIVVSVSAVTTVLLVGLDRVFIYLRNYLTSI